MTKRNVYLAQVNNTYGRSAFLPYSVGLLQAYAQTIPEISEAYEFQPLIYLRENVVNLVGRMRTPDVVGISCYIWNFEWSMAFAKCVKTTWPHCLVVLGGPHIPVRSDGFFDEHPYADILVHYEGEVTFAEVLKERLKQEPNYHHIEGIALRSLVTKNRDRLADLSVIPSPYLAGVFDTLLEKGGSHVEFQASQETHRGCPFLHAHSAIGAAA